MLTLLKYVHPYALDLFKEVTVPLCYSIRGANFFLGAKDISCGRSPFLDLSLRRERSAGVSGNVDEAQHRLPQHSEGTLRGS